MPGLGEVRDLYSKLQAAVKQGDTGKGKALLTRLKVLRTFLLAPDCTVNKHTDTSWPAAAIGAATGPAAQV